MRTRSTDLFARLQGGLPRFTASERQIALFLLNHRESVPFETATSLAKRLGISAVTVGRFCKSLGFRHFRELKGQLRGSISLPWLAGTDFRDFLSNFKDRDQRRQALERDIEQLIAVHERSRGPAWSESVRLIASSRVVQVVGFQTERGIAAMLAYSLQYLRPGVQLVSGESGSFADVLLEGAKDRCLVIVDLKRYSRQSKLLARRASEARIPLVVITDTLCDWAPRYTPNVLAADSHDMNFWPTSVPIAGLVNLLVNDVVGHGGGRDIQKRLARLSALYEEFVGFARPKRGKAKD